MFLGRKERGTEEAPGAEQLGTIVFQRGTAVQRATRMSSTAVGKQAGHGGQEAVNFCINHRSRRRLYPFAVSPFSLCPLLFVLLRTLPLSATVPPPPK